MNAYKLNNIFFYVTYTFKLLRMFWLININKTDIIMLLCLMHLSLQFCWVIYCHSTLPWFGHIHSHIPT